MDNPDVGPPNSPPGPSPNDPQEQRASNEDPQTSRERTPVRDLSPGERQRRGKSIERPTVGVTIAEEGPNVDQEEEEPDLSEEETARFVRWQHQQEKRHQALEEEHHRERQIQEEERRRAEAEWATYHEEGNTSAKEGPAQGERPTPTATQPPQRQAMGTQRPPSQPAPPNAPQVPARFAPSSAPSNNYEIPPPQPTMPTGPQPPVAVTYAPFGSYVSGSSGAPLNPNAGPHPGNQQTPAPPLYNANPGFSPTFNPAANPYVQTGAHVPMYGPTPTLPNIAPPAYPPAPNAPGAPSISSSPYYTGSGYTATQAPTPPYYSPQIPNGAQLPTYVYTPTGLPSYNPNGTYNAPPSYNATYGPPIPNYGPPPPPPGGPAPGKAFMAQKIGKPFLGTTEEEGSRARTFIQKIEMARLSTPGLTSAQLLQTVVTNLGGAAEHWFFTEERAYNAATGTSLVNNWDMFKHLFLQRYGKVDPAQSYFELQNMKRGDKEGLLNFAQRLRDRMFEANLTDERTKLAVFMGMLEEPLKSQIATRLPATFEQAVLEADVISRFLHTPAHTTPTASPDLKSQRSKETTEERPRRPHRAVVRAVEDTPAANPKGPAQPPTQVSQGDRDPPARHNARTNGDSYNRDNRNNDRSNWNNQRRDEGRPRLCYGCGKPGHMRRECPHPSDQKGALLIEGECGCNVCHEPDDEEYEEYDPYEDHSDSAPADFESPASVNAVLATCDGMDSQELAEDDTVQDAYLAEVYAAEEVQAGVRRFLPPQRQPYPVRGAVAPPAPHGRHPVPTAAKVPPSAPKKAAIPTPRPAAPALSEPTRDAGGLATSQPFLANRPTVQGHFPLDWVPMAVAVKHGNPQLVRELQTTVRRALQPLERPPDPRQARNNPAPTVHAIETVNLIEAVEFLDIDPDAPRRSIAKVAARMHGVNGERTIAWLDSGANVDMMSAEHFRKSGLQSRLIKGGARFNVADGTDCFGIGRVDAVVGLGRYLNISTRFIVSEGFRYPILLGVGTIQSMKGIIDYSTDLFRFKLPHSGSWRSLPLLEVNQVTGPPTSMIHPPRPITINTIEVEEKEAPVLRTCHGGDNPGHFRGPRNTPPDPAAMAGWEAPLCDCGIHYDFGRPPLPTSDHHWAICFRCGATGWRHNSKRDAQPPATANVITQTPREPPTPRSNLDNPQREYCQDGRSQTLHSKQLRLDRPKSQMTRRCLNSARILTTRTKNQTPPG